MGGRGSSGSRSEETSYSNKVDALRNASNTPFPDSKETPLEYNKNRLMEVSFGDWKDKKENFLGVKEVDISKIVTVQPYVQANKLKKFKGSVDTSDIKLLKIGNKYYVGDGNHRIVASYLQGKKKVKVQVYKES